MNTSDSLFDPIVYSSNSAMAGPDTLGSTTTDSSYDRLSDLLEGGGIGSSATDTAREQGDHKSCPCGNLPPGEGDNSTTEETGQLASSQAGDRTGARHDTHSSDDTIQYAKSVTNSGTFKVFLVLLLVLIVTKGNISVTAIISLVLWYRLRALRLET